MLIQNLSFIGWIHTLASVVSLFAGGMTLALPKGSATHQRQGQIYVAAMVLTNLTALCIYSHGKIIFAHWLALAGLVSVLGGYRNGALESAAPRLAELASQRHDPQLLLTELAAP